MTLIDDNSKFSLLILAIVGFLLGLCVIGSMRVIRASLASKQRRTDEQQSVDDSRVHTLPEELDGRSAVSEGWRVVSIRTGMVLLAVGAGAMYLTRTLSLDYADRDPSEIVKFRLTILAISLVAALVPALRPRLSSLALGFALGVLTAAAVAVVTIFALGGVDSMLGGLTVFTVVAAPVALGAASLALALAFAMKMASHLSNSAARRMLRFATAAVVIVGVCYLANDWYNRPPTPDAGYRLQPSTWRGEMMYGYRAYPFKLVIEEVDSAGQFVGYMDWDPEHRLKIEGKASANHLVFEDTEFLRGHAQTGIFDRKDVWIVNHEMKGTDKNGRARLVATLMSEPLEVARASHDAPGASSVKAEAKLDPALIARTEAVCKEMVGIGQDGYAAACWSHLALLSARQTYCEAIADQSARSDCLESFAPMHGDLSACKALGPNRFAQCAHAVAAAVRNDGLCAGAFPSESDPQRAVCRAAASAQHGRCLSDLSEPALRLACDRALNNAAQAQSAFRALERLAFFETAATTTVSVCDPSRTQTPQTQSLCRLDQLRRGQGTYCSDITDLSVQSICEKVNQTDGR